MVAKILNALETVTDLHGHDVVTGTSPSLGSTMKICYWNIHGWSSKIIGDKLCDEEFLDKILTYDVVALAELHYEKELSLPGFLNIKQKIRNKTHKGPKIAGGIAVFVKNKYKDLIELMPNKNADSIWVKIKKEKCGEVDDIFIGSFYVSPGSGKSATKKEFYTSLNEELDCFKQKGVVLLQGDLNARVGREPDFIEFDKFDCPLDEVPDDGGSEEAVGVPVGSGGLMDHPLRNSEDRTVNSRGRDLLDLCKVNDLLIANGRVAGDVFGGFTSHQYNGSAVNDYLLTPYDFIHRISKFSVGEYVPWLSDHCPIFCHVGLGSLTAAEARIDKKSDIEPSFIFDINARNKYTSGLKSVETKNRVMEILGDGGLSAADMGSRVNLLLIENAKRCKIKTRKGGRGGPRSAPWFDGECENSKNTVRGFGNDLRRDPRDPGVRQSLQLAKKNLKRLVASKKRGYKQAIVNKMSQSHKSRGGFWGLLGKLSDKKAKISSYVSHNYLTSHFKTLLNSREGVNTPPICGGGGPLDGEITLEELTESSKVSLPTGKAVGVDNLSNEMISCLIELYPELILKLFNSILSSGDIMPEWVISYIVPIHKGGSKSDPSNYRGISLLSCLGKFFLSILNKRLAGFCVEKGILSDNQLGFRKGNRCSDAHLIIHNLIDKYCHKYSSKIYSCFIDLSKAFDTVPRDILLRKLRNFGVTGNFFNIIRNIYTNDRAYIKLDGKITKSFTINQGVRQGCVLSPLLFNIFMADLARSLDTTDVGFMLENIRVNSLFWADDIALFANSPQELEKLLDIVATYCGNNKLTINSKKTKCLIFNKAGRLYRDKITMSGVLLDNVREYKYLGFIFTPSGEIRTGLRDLRDRAFKSFQTLKNKMGDSFNRDVETALGLYDSMIKPVLTYSSDFWGCMKLPKKNNPIEIMQMKVYKQILGVRRQTTNVGVLLELGRHTLDYECIKFGIKNWERIREGNANKLLIDSYNDALREDLPWVVGVGGHLLNSGLDNVPPSADGKPFIYKKIHEALRGQFRLDSLSAIKKPDQKLRTYALLKTGVGLEKYLKEIRNVSIRTQFSKFRLSDHNLTIETGRHKGISAELRFCPFCGGGVENEVHFLLECPIYDRLREADPVFRGDSVATGISSKEKFILLMSKLPQVATTIHNFFELRNFLLSCPKRTI